MAKNHVEIELNTCSRKTSNNVLQHGHKICVDTRDTDKNGSQKCPFLWMEKNWSSQKKKIEEKMRTNNTRSKI